MTKKEYSFSDFSAAVHIDFLKIKKINGLTETIRKSAGTIPDWNFKIADDNSVTFHDVSIAQLIFLIKAYPLADVLDIETTIDFRPIDDHDVACKLIWLHNHLRDNLHPRDPKNLLASIGKERRWRRKYTHPITNKYIEDELISIGGNLTFVWDKRSGREQVRMYIKNGVVRLEATLRKSGVQSARVHKLALLPHHLERSRVYHTPFFKVAAGLRMPTQRIRVTTPAKRLIAEHAADKERRRLQRSWDLYGAAGAMKHGRQTHPNRDASKMIGVAFKRFRSVMKAAKLTEKVADMNSDLKKEYVKYQTVKDDSKPI